MFPRPLPLTETPGSDPNVTVEGFEAVPVGDSLLLRVHVTGVLDRSSAKLILDGGRGFDVVSPLPGTHGALGFVVHGRSIQERMRFWLDVDGRIGRLGTPELCD